jgi:hypothetical protein
MVYRHHIILYVIISKIKGLEIYHAYIFLYCTGKYMHDMLKAIFWLSRINIGSGDRQIEVASDFHISVPLLLKLSSSFTALDENIVTHLRATYQPVYGTSASPKEVNMARVLSRSELFGWRGCDPCGRRHQSPQAGESSPCPVVIYSILRRLRPVWISDRDHFVMWSRLPP